MVTQVLGGRRHGEAGRSRQAAAQRITVSLIRKCEDSGRLPGLVNETVTAAGKKQDPALLLDDGRDAHERGSRSPSICDVIGGLRLGVHADLAGAEGVMVSPVT
jgi:hypothetical protein